MKNKFKVFLGFISLLLFIILFVQSGGGFGKVENTLKRYWNNFFPSSREFSTSNSIFKQPVVEEESAVIDVVKSVSPAVVSVVVKNISFSPFSGPMASEQGIGTGFIVDSNGLIVTNSHVVSDQNSSYSVVLRDGQTYDVDKVNLDPQTDLAILEIRARDLPTVELGDSDALQVGQKAVAIGNALGRFQNTVTAGVVSGIARELTAVDSSGINAKTYEGAIQTDAALNPGNSGGPLLNSSGQVIGINVATTQGADNIGFAIPVNTLKPILESFLKDGRIIRPYLGIEYSMITKELAQIRRLPEGAFVSRIVANSPAAKAGLQRGDIIVRFDGKVINSDTSLATLIREKNVGDKVDMVVDRNGKEITLPVTLQESPSSN